MVNCPIEFNDWVEKTEAQRKKLIDDVCRSHT